MNCVQCHPSECVVATSGIDSTIKVRIGKYFFEHPLWLRINDSMTISQIWTPVAQTASIVAGGTAGPEASDVLSVIEENQQKLCHARHTVL